MFKLVVVAPIDLIFRVGLAVAGKREYERECEKTRDEEDKNNRDGSVASPCSIGKRVSACCTVNKR